MITMKQIGELANVSRPTVSLILNGKAEKFNISPKTVKRVKDIVEKTGYKPNLLARSMKTGKTGVIGLLQREDGIRQIASGENPNSMFMRLYAHLLLMGKNVLIIPESIDDVQKCSIPDRLSNQLVDTLIINDSLLYDDANSVKYLEKLKKYCTKCIGIAVNHDDISSVNFDNFNAGYMIADNFIKKGCRTFAVLGSEAPDTDFKNRQYGFCKRIAETFPDVKVELYTAQNCWDIKCGAEAVSKMLDSADKLPDAIFALNDYFIHEAVAELQRKNIDDKKIIFGAVGNSINQINCRYPLVYAGFDDAEYIQSICDLLDENENSCSKKLLHVSIIDQTAKNKI